MEKNTNDNAVVIGIVSAILGLAVGFLGASIIIKPVDNSTIIQPSTETKAANIRVSLNTQFKQYVNLISDATREYFSDDENQLNAVKNTLTQNTESIATILKNTYGEESSDEFTNIWNTYNNIFLEYTNASKENSSVKMAEVSSKLESSAESISTLFSELNSNLPKDALIQLFSENLALLKASIDAYASDNFAQSYEKQSEAITQIGGIADAISGAIVKQNPDSFR